VSVEQMTLGVYEILKGGGFETGGLMFDTKLRRQSIDRADLFHGHIAGIDVMARSLLVAAALLEDGALQGPLEERYRGWDEELGRRIMGGEESLESLRDRQLGAAEPQPSSGRQEVLERIVNQYIERTA
jgi:xylose isomerase